MVAQLWQAAGSFALQILAAHLLGATGLGTFALCFGVIVLATALVGGVVGDSLTVLDRDDRGVRSGLEWWALVLLLGTSLAGSVALVLTGMLTVPQAAAFGVASVLFQAEEIIRRLFMAELRFWRLVVIDTISLAGALAAIGVSAALGTVSLLTLLVGLAVGQAMAFVVAVAMLPAKDRRVVSLRGARIAAVASFGVWRGAQVAVNPGVLTAFRSLVVIGVGTAALGEIEAARILVAPAILLVQGLGSYLLASYARDKNVALRVLQTRANRASLAMSSAIVLVGGVAALMVPYLGPLVAGTGFAVSGVAVFCWALYAAASATMQPFASLCAARGRPRQVFTVRVVDSVVGLALAAIALLVLNVPVTVAPFALALGLLLGGVLVRSLVLRPLVRLDALSPRPTPPLASTMPRSQAVTR
jgi:O-antigen/teichoic acid export membrane protein